MILAYENIGDTIQVLLCKSDGTQLDRVEISTDEAKPKERPDLLLEITKLLEKNAATPKQIEGIVFVNGPGRFTPMRTACVVANLFARELNIPLYPVTVDTFAGHDSDFTKMIGAGLPEPAKYAEALFNAPPRITLSDKIPTFSLEN